MSTEYGIVIVGGGPTGATTGVFTARAGLDTFVFDRGRSSIKRCAHLENGWWEGVASGVDWVRREAELGEERTDQEFWIEGFDEHFSENAPVGPDSERFRRVREAWVDDRLSTYFSDDEIDASAKAGQRVLLDHVADEVIHEGARVIETDAEHESPEVRS